MRGNATHHQLLRRTPRGRLLIHLHIDMTISDKFNDHIWQIKTPYKKYLDLIWQADHIKKTNHHIWKTYDHIWEIRPYLRTARPYLEKVEDHIWKLGPYQEADMVRGPYKFLRYGGGRILTTVILIKYRQTRIWFISALVACWALTISAFTFLT